MRNGGPGELHFHSCVKGYQGGDLQYKMKYLLANMKKEMHWTCLNAVNVAIAFCHHFFDSTLIAVDGTSRDSRPSGMVKQLVVMIKLP